MSRYRFAGTDRSATYRTYYLGRVAVHVWDDGAVHLDIGNRWYWRFREKSA